MSGAPQSDDQGSTSRLRDGLLREGVWTDSDAATEPLTIGKYKVVAELGRGGMGIVYRAWDTELRRDVALKLLRVHDRRNPEMASRILREARTAAPLDHPGIVPIHDVGEVQGTPYYVMAFVEGRTLAAVLREDGLPPMRERARIVRDAAEAVAHAHARSVVHRDLKPSNLLLDREGRVHVLDFGLAKNLEDATQLTATGQVLGTAAYMPPEQVDGPADQTGPASDVYALGAVLYETLTGQPPFTGESFTQVVVRSLARDPVSPRVRDAKVPLDLETICLKALRKDPAQRYPTAREMADDLSRFLGGEAILARPESAMERAMRWIRRHRAASIAAMVAVVAVGVAGVERWDAARRAEEQARVEREFLQFLREIADTDLRVVLDLRRQGVIGEVPERLLARLERAARDTAKRAPGLAEPNYHLGRMHRALQRFEEALEEQDAALAKEPGFVPSLYERAVLRALFYRRRLEALREAWQRRVGRELADVVAKPGLDRRELPRSPKDTELARDDEEAQRLHAGIQADLDLLDRETRGSPSGARDVSGAMSACARGLFLLYGAAEDRRDEGRARLAEALSADPTLEEAYEAQADADLAAGDLDAAIEVYARASAVDRGYIPFRVGSGQALTLRGQTALRCGEDPVPWFEKAVEAFTAAIQLASEWAEAWVGRGRAHAAWGDWIGDTGGDPAPRLRLAVEDLDRALILDPASVDAHRARGWAIAVLGQHEGDRGGDGREYFLRAVEAYDMALGREQTAEMLEERADAYRWWAMEAKSRGEDPTALFQASIEDCTKALALDVRSFGAWRRRAGLRLALAIYGKTRGGDPTGAFPEVLADLEKARELNPEHVGLWLELGILFSTWGQVLAELGEDPSERFGAADECLAKAESLNPTLAAAAEHRAAVEWRWAEFELVAGRDGIGHLARAEVHLARAKASEFYTVHEALGEVAVLRGRDAERRGIDPTSHYDRAEEEFAAALSKNARSTGAWIGRAAARRRRAFLLARRGEDAVALFRSSLEDADKALSLDSAWDKVWHARALVFRDRGAALGVEADLRAAEADFGKALSINPGAVDSWIARAETRLLLSDLLGGAADMRAQALSDLDRALSLAPRRSDAVALRDRVR